MIRTVLGERIETEFKEVLQSELNFSLENPRVITIVRNLEKGPTQEGIFDILSKMDHVKELKKDIKNTGGLFEPVIVRRSTNEVIEGNCRLAAYRLLYHEDSVKWANIHCEILPENITEDQIYSILAKLNISGKTPWSAFEQAGYLWRLHKEEKKSINQLHDHFGIAPVTLNNYINTFQFMLDNNLTDQSKFSHWLVLNTNKHIKKIKKDFIATDFLSDDRKGTKKPKRN
jgi:hypothetical protein